jgi:hypothetical protein
MILKNKKNMTRGELRRIIFIYKIVVIVLVLYIIWLHRELF